MLRGIRGKDKKADSNGRELRQGIGLVLIVMISVAAFTSILLFMAYRLYPVLGVAVE